MVQRKNPSSKPTVRVSSDEDSEPIMLQSSNRGRRRQDNTPQTPRNSRRNGPTPASGLQFLQGGSSASAPVNRLAKDTATTPTRSSRHPSNSKHQKVQSTKAESSSRLRQRVEPASDDSTDSLMDELRISRQGSDKETPRTQNESDKSSDDEVRTPRRRRNPPADIDWSVGNSNTANGKQTHDGHGKRRGFTRAKRPAVEKIARQKQLELLRRRRAGKDEELPSDDDDLEVGEQYTDVSADLDELDGEGEDSGTEHVRRADPPNLDEYEEDFVDDNADDTIGAPNVGLDDIPLEFTRHAHKKPFEHFKDVVEWMVHNKLNPAFARNDPVYTIAVHKMDDVVQGYAGSKFTSSAWKEEFVKALRKFPNCARTDVPTMLEQKCEACGRSGHPAKHQLVFSGKPYHRDSLEDVSSDDETDSDKDGASQPPHTHTKAFFLGRTCNANAETAHALHHWRHQLNHFVLKLLREEGHLAPEKIVERENWNKKKRERYADGVVDAMDAVGQMRVLYREFKENLEAARGTQNEGSYYGRRG